MARHQEWINESLQAVGDEIADMQSAVKDATDGDELHAAIQPLRERLAEIDKWIYSYRYDDAHG